MKLKDMPMNLTKKEKLMLVNDPPDSVLQLSLVNIIIFINVQHVLH